MTVYYVCKYAPLELIAGYGTDFAALDPLAESFSCAESCAHANLCGYVKAILQRVEQGDIHALVLTNCCDAMRRVYDVLNAAGKLDFLYFLPLPHRGDDAAVKHFSHLLGDFAAALGAYTGTAFDAALALRWFVEKPQANGPHLTLLGAHGGSVLYHTVQREFSLPVRDATCFGNRSVPRPACPVPTLEAFLAAYAPLLLRQTPCMRMLDAPDARAALSDPDTKGLIYHTVKFCDYYGPAFAMRGGQEVPMLKIETDCSAQTYSEGSGQLHTRLSAFAESLDAVPQASDASEVSLRSGAAYAAGIDSGSASTDAAILDCSGKLVGWAIVPTGAGAAAGAQQALEQALAMAKLTENDLAVRVSTGYGRDYISAQGGTSITEITCHARGAHHLDADVRTVIDIGGQDSKVIRIDETGAVQSFVMNDKCAAGTGRFLEMMARTMQLPLEKMSALGLQWKGDVTISSMCTVFAESEVVSLIAKSTPPADIIHGLNKSVAGKTAALAKRAGGGPKYMMTGGVARNAGVVRELEKALGAPVEVSEYSQLCGSLGAALFALDRLTKKA
jgi:predicted CoA-substrate-specific enzyme activase